MEQSGTDDGGSVPPRMFRTIQRGIRKVAEILPGERIIAVKCHTADAGGYPDLLVHIEKPANFYGSAKPFGN